MKHQIRISEVSTNELLSYRQYLKEDNPFGMATVRDVEEELALRGYFVGRTVAKATFKLIQGGAEGPGEVRPEHESWARVEHEMPDVFDIMEDGDA